MKHFVIQPILIVLVGIIQINAEQSNTEKVYFEQEIVGPVFELEDVHVAPCPVSHPSPEYPNGGKIEDFHRNCPTSFLFVISKEGSVVKISNIRTDCEEFIPCIIETVKKWKFKPAVINGEPVHCRVRLPIPMKYNR